MNAMEAMPPIDYTQLARKSDLDALDVRLAGHIAEAAAHHVPDGWMRMPSAAGHDPMVIAEHLPCAMLFIPSIGGVSHDFAEDSREEDIVLGCRVLAHAAESILSASR